MSPEQPSHKIGKSVGEKLRAARVAQKYTQGQLAAPDFSVSYISAIERGQIHPSLRALEILAARLGMTSTQLLPNKTQQEERGAPTTNLSEREEHEIELDLLQVQVQIALGEAEQTVKTLEKLAGKRLKQHHQLRQRYLLGWAYYNVARYQESEYILSEAAGMARELNAHSLNLRILHQLALTYAAMHNYSQALLSHQLCLKLLEESEVQDPFFTAQIYIHMGHHYVHLDNVEQALEMYSRAISATRDQVTLQQMEVTYTHLCQYYDVIARDRDLATLSAYKSIQCKHQAMARRMRGELYYYLGQAVIRGDTEQARKYLDETLRRPDVAQDELTQASVLTRDAEWHLNQGAYDQAENSVRQAYELGQHSVDTLIGADILIMLGRIEYAQGQTEAGEQHFVAGLDMLERLNSHEELANESVRYAELLEKIGKEREAFAHFRRAFQSKQRLGK
jgi:tetratricopeptide (TPR) repeat protein